MPNKVWRFLRNLQNLSIFPSFEETQPFGPGFRLRYEGENSRRYFRGTYALMNLNSVAGLRSADSWNSCGLTKRVVSPSTRRSSLAKFDALLRERLLIRSCARETQLRPGARRPAEEFREGNEQMDRQEERIAHESQIITPANLHKTAL